MRRSLASLLLLFVAASNARGADDTASVLLYNTHTGERLRVGRYLPSPRALDRFLRSRKARRYTLMDPRLVLAAVTAARAHGRTAVHIISAFRPRALNEAMRLAGHKVARRSRHTSGQALDLRIPGLETRALCRYFDRVHGGGVGCYQGARFVHIDVGPRRRWGFGR
ncbi:MAG: DUF882 domain-containing protein [Myxococcales bacterium]|nr:DUF882 domain-containing protein [Myxococcales bacterium]